MLQATNDAIVDWALKTAIAIEYLCHEHRQCFSRWVAAFAMCRQMRLNSIEKTAIGEQIEHANGVESAA